MSVEEEKQLAEVVEQVIRHVDDKDALRTSLKASLCIFHSIGYRSGYADAMNDAKNGKDQRVIAHLN